MEERMVDLKQMLSRFLTIPGVRLAVLVGRDGLLIEGLSRDGKEDMETVGAYMATGLNTAEALGQEISRGGVVGVLTEYEQGLVSVEPLGAFEAGAFSSSRHVAELLGEKDFRTIFQQGVHENIYTTMVGDQWLLVIVFDKLTHIGLVKVLSKRASEELGRTLERVRADTNRQKSSVLNIQFRSSVEDTIDILFRA